MKKYWRVAKNTWDEMLTYRLNFMMYRVRSVLSFLTFYFLWIALLPANGSLFGYSQSLMLTYVIGTALLNAFVLSSRSYTVGDDIIQGNLSNYLIKPMHYFLYWVARDIGDKAMNISFATVELTILFLLLRPPLYVQTDAGYLFVFFLSVLIAMSIYFCFNLILGMIGFWSPEVWAPRFIFMIVVSFFSGGYFPLDILPKPLYAVFTVLPFQYLLYFPLQVYLKRIPATMMFFETAIGIAWVMIMVFTVDRLWKKGLSVYTAQGS
jgi:ABC-2 type transport system permease protein